jgi:hypothetical protein
MKYCRLLKYSYYFKTLGNLPNDIHLSFNLKVLLAVILQLKIWLLWCCSYHSNEVMTKMCKIFVHLNSECSDFKVKLQKCHTKSNIFQMYCKAGPTSGYVLLKLCLAIRKNYAHCKSQLEIFPPAFYSNQRNLCNYIPRCS